MIIPASVLPIVACSKIEIGDENLSGGNDVLKDVAANLRGQGSSSVLPIISEFQDALSNKDFQYEGTGSGDGLKVGTGEISGKDFGMTSSLKRPSTSSQISYWTSHKMRTITFAIDAIGIALHLPSDLRSKFSESNRPIIDATELVKLYDKDTTNDNVTWSDLLLNQEADNYKQTIFPLGRTGGKSSSGTADGFFNGLTKASGLKDESTLDLNHVNLGPNHQTAEANAQAKQTLESIDNSLTYLSLGYALSNESNDLIVASIKTAAGNNWEPSLANVQTKNYGWTRPFNVIYSTINEKALTFAKFLLTENVQRQVNALDFVRLTQDQNDQQKNITISDAELVQDVSKGQLGLDV